VLYLHLMRSAQPPDDSSLPIEKYVIQPMQGRPLRTDLDNIGEVIAEVEGDEPQVLASAKPA